MQREDTHGANLAKLYKSIFELAAATDCNPLPSTFSTVDLVECLRQCFNKPWQNITPNEIPNVEEVEHLLKVRVINRKYHIPGCLE